MLKKPKNTEGIFVRRQNKPLDRAQRPEGSGVPQHFLIGSDGVKPPTTQKTAGMPPVLTRPAQAPVPNSMPEKPGMQDPKTIDIDLSLDDEQAKGKKKRGLRGWRPSRKFFKRLAIVVGILLLLGLGYFAYKLLVASGNIFRGGGESILGDDGIDKSKLQHEGDGRVNILLAATSEDDPNHPGSTLTDSIMVVSVDPINKGVALVSIPRDLWVDIPGCTMYSQEKINAVYQCGEEIGFKEEGYADGGMGMLQKVVETATGVNINYSARINYTAFREAVDAVGGIDITIASPDPRGILDRNFDWICNYQCYKVKHPNGEVHLDGEHALYLARSRNSVGGYGMPRGDFDRTEYQRKMLIALKDKAASLETLSNPVKLSGLIDSIGNNLVTNFSRDDLINLYSLAKDIKDENTKSIGLTDGDNPLVTTGAVGGASVVHPVVGLFEYGEIQKYLRGQMLDPYVVNEAPTIALFNGTEEPGLATAQKDILESYGYKVVIVGDAPAKDYGETEFYDNTRGAKEITRQYLQNRYNTQATTDDVPEGIDATYDTGELDEEGNPKPRKTADYVIILGRGAGN